MDQLNVRQEAFLQKMVREKTPAGAAYQEVYKVKDPMVAGANASRLLKNAKIEAHKEKLEKEVKREVRAIFQKAAKGAAKRLVQISEDKKNTPEARKAANDVMRLANLEPASKQEVKTTAIHPGLTDDQSYDELLKNAYQKRFGNQPIK